MSSSTTKLILERILSHGFCDALAEFAEVHGADQVARSLRLLTHDDDIIHTGNGRYALYGAMPQLLNGAMPSPTKVKLLVEQSLAHIVAFDPSILNEVLGMTGNQRWKQIG